MKINKPKIAVIGLKGLPAFGGAAAVGENIIEQLKDIYDFTVYAISSHTNKKGDYNGFKQIVFKSIPFKKLNTLYYYIVSALHAVVFGNYDLIHLHHRDAAFIILILKLRYGSILLTTHGIFRLLDKWKYYRWYFTVQEKIFIRFANAITCVSLNEKRLFKKILNMDAHHIPNGINEVVALDSGDSKRKDYLFFGAGRIIHSKGCDVMLKALNILNYEGKILIAGDIDQTPEHRNLLIELALTLHVDFLGLIKDKNNLLNYIKNAKFFIFPSSIEAMSMMLLEAASVKTPIICSDIIENRDIFNEEEVLFFRTDDPNDLAKKINWALQNPDIMQLCAEKAYKKLKDKYLWGKIAKQYSEYYERLMKV